MKRSQRLKIVVDIAQREQEKSARAFQQARDAHQQEITKLEELERYYQDYEKSFSAKTAGLRASDIANARALLQQIVAVQEGQKLQISNARQIMEQAKKEWHLNRLKCENLEGLIKRYRVEEDKEAEVLEQKIMDEWVSQNNVNRDALK